MQFLSVRAKFIASFGIMLLLICAVGAFSLWQLSVLTELNRYTTSSLLPGSTTGGRLDGEIADMRVAEAEYLLTVDPTQKKSAETRLFGGKARDRRRYQNASEFHQ